MNDLFERRVRGAAVAGWWTVLVGYALVWLSWLLYLWVMSARPSWLATLIGEGVTWSQLQTLWLWLLAAFKVCIALGLLATLWMTLWARELRKNARTS